MLWMKAWFETRWRLLYALGLPLSALALRVPGGIGSTKDARTTMFAMSFFLVFAAVYLAGAGVRTQSSFQMTKGLHGSTYFTLSLPVSRFRLLAVRTGFGLLEMAGINAVVIALAWSLFPFVRANSTPLDLLEAILAAIVCTTCFYLVSVFAATFLGELWHIWTSLLVVCCAWWAVARLALTPSVDIFRFLGDASPLITHTLPWPAIGISVFVSAILFLAAFKIVQTREY